MVSMVTISLNLLGTKDLWIGVGDCDPRTKDLFQGIVTPGMESSKELFLVIVIVALKRSTRDLCQGILTLLNRLDY